MTLDRAKICLWKQRTAGRWRKHFQQILNRPDVEKYLNITIGSINLQKAKNVHRLKNRKPSGEDGICADMVKEEEQKHHDLSSIFSRVSVTRRKYPRTEKGIIVKLPTRHLEERGGHISILFGGWWYRIHLRNMPRLRLGYFAYDQ